MNTTTTHHNQAVNCSPKRKKNIIRRKRKDSLSQLVDDVNTFKKTLSQNSDSSYKEALRSKLLQIVIDEAPQVYSFQRFFGVTRENPNGHTIISYFFTFSAALGNELFFIIFLPLLFWLFSVKVAFCVCQVWGVTYYVGQFLKDYMMLPRPDKSVVVRIDSFYDQEYGFPSTHVMGAIAIPFYLFCNLYREGTISEASIIFPILWVLPISGSRLYLGVHSPLDMYVGACLAFLILGAFVLLGIDVYLLDWANDVQSSRDFIVPFLIALLLVYPAPKVWSGSFGDTALILGVIAGVTLGYKTLVDTAVPHVSSYENTQALDQDFYWSFFIRSVIGFPLIGLTRQLSKIITMTLFSYLFPPTDATKLPKHHYEIEVPSKFIIYSLVGFNAVFTSYYLFDRIGV